MMRMVRPHYTLSTLPQPIDLISLSKCVIKSWAFRSPYISVHFLPPSKCSSHVQLRHKHLAESIYNNVSPSTHTHTHTVHVYAPQPYCTHTCTCREWKYYNQCWWLWHWRHHDRSLWWQFCTFLLVHAICPSATCIASVNNNYSYTSGMCGAFFVHTSQLSINTFNKLRIPY